MWGVFFFSFLFSFQVLADCWLPTPSDRPTARELQSRLEIVEMTAGDVSQRMEAIVHARSEWKFELHDRMEKEAQRRAREAEERRADEQDTIAAFADIVTGQEYVCPCLSHLVDLIGKSASRVVKIAE